MLLRYAFAEKVSDASLPGDVLDGIARMSLQHASAGALARRWETRQTDMPRGAMFLGIAMRVQRQRSGGFIADNVIAWSGRADCCGREGPVAEICSLCSVATCERCVRDPPRHSLHYTLDGLAPECACMFNAAADVMPVARSAECMLDDDSGLLRPVWV